MRTSIDFPEELFRSLKANAALQGTSLRDHVIGLIERGRAVPVASAAAPVKPRPVPPIPSISIPGLVWPKDHMVKNEQVNAVLEQDEYERYLKAFKK